MSWWEPGSDEWHPDMCDTPPGYDPEIDEPNEPEWSADMTPIEAEVAGFSEGTKAYMREVRARRNSVHNRNNWVMDQH
jgi:hypothetical protein